MRHRLSTTLPLVVAGLLFIAPLTYAQDLGNQLEGMGDAYADGYVQPLTNALGADLNAGLFRTADVGNGFLPGLPINVYVGVGVSGALIPDSDKHFIFEGETVGAGTRELDVSATPPDNRVPTAFGSENPEGELVFEETQTGIEVDRRPIPRSLIDTPIAPLPIAQIGVGAVAGTDFQFRYLPRRDVSGYGTVGVTGVAVRHDLDQWVPGPVPINVAVQGAWNEISVETDGSEVFNASGWALNLQASKGVPVVPLVIYGGLQYESFGVDVNYTYAGPFGASQEIEFSQDSEISTRVLAGFSFTLFVVRFNADYAITNGNNVVTAGFGVRL